MPPKPKCSREDIINAAYELMTMSGIDAISAREVGKKLGTTTAPIFTFFESMNELKEEVYQLAYKECSSYLAETLDTDFPYKEFGTRWIKYAYEKPHVYSMLFVKKRPNGAYKGFLNEDFEDVLVSMRKIVMKTYELSDEDSKKLVDNMCTYAQGIATFLVNGLLTYDEEEIDRNMSRMCMSFVAGCKIVDGNLDVDLFRRRLT
ncbi:MAG: TetR family transcriptional regulator [Clostridia bacterium]|nr:TetR family transcriptional regulator [Clostridia bacterium]